MCCLTLVPRDLLARPCPVAVEFAVSLELLGAASPEASPVEGLPVPLVGFV